VGALLLSRLSVVPLHATTNYCLQSTAKSYKVSFSGQPKTKS
jgi:hypothetical protein